MAGSSQVTVGTAPTLLASCPPALTPGPLGWVSLSNGGTVPVYVGGGTNVSTSNGYAIAASGALQGYVFAGDNLYALTSTSTAAVSVLQTGL